MPADATHLSALSKAGHAGFKFVHLKDDHGVTAIFAERRSQYGVESFICCGPTEAAGARYRAEDYPTGDPVWQIAGTVQEVVLGLLELPARPPQLAVRRSSSLWTPGEPL